MKIKPAACELELHVCFSSRSSLIILWLTISSRLVICLWLSQETGERYLPGGCGGS